MAAPTDDTTAAPRAPLERQRAVDAQQAAAARAWAAQVQGAQTRAAGVDWSKVDWSKLTAQDVGVRLGPVMTEEQFKAYRAQSGRNVQVVRAPAPDGKKP